MGSALKAAMDAANWPGLIRKSTAAGRGEAKRGMAGQGSARQGKVFLTTKGRRDEKNFSCNRGYDTAAVLQIHGCGTNERDKRNPDGFGRREGYAA